MTTSSTYATGAPISLALLCVSLCMHSRLKDMGVLFYHAVLLLETSFLTNPGHRPAASKLWCFSCHKPLATRGCLLGCWRLELRVFMLQQHVHLPTATSAATQPHFELPHYLSHDKRYTKKNPLALTFLLFFVTGPLNFLNV